MRCGKMWGLIVVGLLGATSMARAADETGLVAYYKFDEGQGAVAHDSSSFQNDATIEGAQWSKLPEGYALKFDGVNDVVDCGAPPQFDVRKAVTLSAWVCPIGIQLANEPGIFGKQFSSFLLSYYLNRKLYWYINSGGNNLHAFLPPDQWSHIAATYDGQTMRIYVNGEQVGEKPLAAEINPGGHLTIGALIGDAAATDPNYQNTAAFKGYIDDVKLFNRALSPDEIAAQRQANPVDRNAVFAVDPVTVTSGPSIRRGDVVVRADKNGALQINNGASYFVVESSFSYPGAQIGHNALAVAPQAGEPNWKPRVRRLDANTLQIEASGANYKIRRRIALRNGRIEWSDSYTNLRKTPVGIMISHKLIAPQTLSNARAMNTADNPTIFFTDGQSDFGVVAEDDIGRLQFEAVASANNARLSHSRFTLDAGKSYTFRYAVYPLPQTGQWFDFINRLRRDWKTNFTVEGPWSFFDVTSPLLNDSVALRAYLKRRNLKILALSPWLEYDPGLMDHVLTRPEYKALMQDAMKKLRAASPGIKLTGCIETDWVDLNPKLVPNSQVLYTGTPAEFTKAIEEANLPWKDSVKRDANGYFALERYTRGGKPQLALAVYPAPGNYQEKFLLDQARFLMDEVGMDGFYIDEFNQAWNQSIRSYDSWDGHFADINAETGEIARRYVNCSLVGIPSRLKIIQAALSRGKSITTNTYATSQAEQALPAQRFWEMQSYLELANVELGKKPPFVYEMSEGLLASPIGLGITESSSYPQKGEGLMAGLISYLRHGLLYYYYWYPDLPETGPASGEYGPITHMFPFTPVSLNEGWLEGRERIITCLSKTYVWKGDKEPKVFLFDRTGRPKLHNFAVTKSGKVWNVDVQLKDWEEIAIIEQ